MGDKFFSIRNWKKFQHYKERNPPWVRLYRDLLRDRAYQSLSDTSRSHLVGLFLVAAYTDNRIPDDQVWLRHELCTKVPIDLKTLAASGWIQYETQDASSMLASPEMLADCKQVATETPLRDRDRDRSTETETEVQMLAYGEFQSVRLSVVEHEKLKARLNGNLETLITRLDRYSQSNPKEFRKYKSHYAVLLNWYDMAIERGTIKPKVLSSMPSEAEMDAMAEKMFGRKK